MADADLDLDPGNGEWTIRQTLAHAVNVERAYPSFSAWWLTREQTAELPPSVPDDVGIGFPEEEEEGVGTLLDIRDRLDAAMDGAAERMSGLDEAQLAIPARWSGYAVDVGFRLWRQASHLQEHTVQVEKTFVMLGRQPLEAERLARLVLRAYGHLEAEVYALPSALAERGRDTVLGAVGAVGEVAEARARRCVGGGRRPMSIERVFVIGAGLMGHGIAQVSAAAGKQVTLSDRTAELAEKGRARIGGNLARQVEKGKLEQAAADEILARIGSPRAPMGPRATTSSSRRSSRTRPSSGRPGRR